MSGFCKRLGAAALAAGCAWMLLGAAPAFAGADAAWRVDPLTLPPAQRQQALTARLGRTGPFGEPAAPGCIWTRIQVPTAQGLRWIDEENCDNQGTWH
jgi:hypothetical protein